MDYAAAAGFAGGDLSTAVAIALAESSGNPNAYNPETKAAGGTPAGKGSYGLWQIYLRDHPEFSGADLYDPQTNAMAAYSLYVRAGGFRDWATYTAGTYQKYLSSVPLTLDAATGLPVENTTDTQAIPADAGGSYVEASMIPSLPSGSNPTITLIVLAVLGLATIYLLER